MVATWDAMTNQILDQFGYLINNKFIVVVILGTSEHGRPSYYIFEVAPFDVFRYLGVDYVF